MYEEKKPPPLEVSSTARRSGVTRKRGHKYNTRVVKRRLNPSKYKKYKKKSRKKMPTKRKRKRTPKTAVSRSTVDRMIKKAFQRQDPAYSEAVMPGYSWRDLEYIASNAPEDSDRKKAESALWYRFTNKIYGRGDYFSAMKRYGKWAARGIGAAATAAPYAMSGDYSAAGRALKRGWGKGARVSKILGMGDYGMSSNQIVHAGGLPSNPHQNIHHVSTADADLTGDVLYSNTEFVENIYANVTGTSGQSGFENRSYSINPGLTTTFPFLSQIAQNFELYEFVGLSFQYKPTSGEFGNNNSNSLGKVVLCTNYDPDALPFTNSVVMENYDYACSTKPSSGCLHGVECAPSQRSAIQMYTRTGVSSTKDRVYTDLGIFQLATEGVPFGGTGDRSALIGELWVTYTVKLSRSKLNAVLGENILYGSLSGTITNPEFLPGTLAAGSTLELSSEVELGGFGVRVSLPINIVVGAYLIVFRANYDADGPDDLIVDGPINCTLPGGGKAPGNFTPSQLKERSAELQISVDEPGKPVSFRCRLRNPGSTGTWAVTLTQIDPDYISPGGYF